MGTSETKKNKTPWYHKPLWVGLICTGLGLIGGALLSNQRGVAIKSENPLYVDMSAHSVIYNLKGQLVVYGNAKNGVTGEIVKFRAISDDVSVSATKKQ